MKPNYGYSKSKQNLLKINRKLELKFNFKTILIFKTKFLLYTKFDFQMKLNFRIGNSILKQN